MKMQEKRQESNVSKEKESRVLLKGGSLLKKDGKDKPNSDRYNLYACLTVSNDVWRCIMSLSGKLTLLAIACFAAAFLSGNPYSIVFMIAAAGMFFASFLVSITRKKKSL